MKPMKKVILIGDSIKFGYAKYVQTALDGIAEVDHPKDSARFAEYTLRYVHEWKAEHGWPDDVDVVHWNVGLWDALELFGDEPLSTVDYYEMNIRRIHNRLKMLFPKAKLIFATSTAVLEQNYDFEFRRHNTNIEAFNAAALRALADTDEVINDLYAVTSGCPEDWYSDAVTHFECRKGVEQVGGAVVRAICRELDVTPVAVDMDTFERETYSAKVIGF